MLKKHDMGMEVEFSAYDRSWNRIKRRTPEISARQLRSLRTSTPNYYRRLVGPYRLHFKTRKRLDLVNLDIIRLLHSRIFSCVPPVITSITLIPLPPSFHPPSNWFAATALPIKNHLIMASLQILLFILFSI